MTAVPDLAQIRLDNAMRLFDEFVHQAARHPDAATLRGLEGRFAERLQIQPSYWSQIKGRSRQIGERLARQFERCMHKPMGWMDQRHTGPSGGGAATRADTQRATAADPRAAHASSVAELSGPQTDDERFIVGLVLTYYRRHPERARARLLELLSEVLAPAAASSASTPAPRSAPVDDRDAWRRAAQGVAPLKKKR